MFFVTLLNQIYWVLGATLGGLFGPLITFNTEGLDFVMTAMFVVIFLEQYLKDKNHLNSYIGLGVSLLMLLFFCADNFMIPAIAGILICLSAARKRMEEKEEDTV